MIKLPDFRLGGHLITTIYKVLPDDVFAYYAADLKQIQMNSNRIVSKSVELQIWLHEVTHAIEDVFLVKMLPEDVIDKFAQGLFQLLEGTPKLLELFDDNAKKHGRRRSGGSDTRKRG